MATNSFVTIQAARRHVIEQPLDKKVSLVCMPWGSVVRPSLAMATLKGCVQAAGFKVHLQFLNMHFAEHIGVSLYEHISDFAFPPTEWFFAQALFGPAGLKELNNTWTDIVSDERAQELLNNLRESVNKSDDLCMRIANVDVPWFLDYCMSKVDWSQYMAVGFTTTFAQSLASLALARRIKQTYPEVYTVFGGANVDDEMGIEFLKGFQWIDYVVHGEAERTFPWLLTELAAGNTDVSVPGVSFRRGSNVVARHQDAQPLANLEEAPIPDYSDYIQTAEKLGWRKKMASRLYFEGSRGCWWGAKHHCTFCGLNGKTMSFRKKSSQRVYAEILHLASEYRCLALSATDNIMSMDYFSELLPQLASRDVDLRLFYEVKANLRRDQLIALKAAGIREIQPGIESLNSRILDLMRKGTTAIQNIQLLKWCTECDISPSWNLLYGFPGERAEDYNGLDRTFGLLMHLQPPHGLSPVVFERFSPYFFDRDKFRLKLKPSSFYQFVFPESRVVLRNIAYFFDGEWEGREGDPDDYIAPTRRAWDLWKQLWHDHSAYCYFEKGPGYVVIHDNRPRIPDASLKPRQQTLTGTAADLYLFCDQNRSRSAIHEMLKQRHDQCESEGRVQQYLDHMVASGMMFREGDRYLSLAVRKKTAARSAAIGS
jgi:ribosomal peptide maturation radical SAM protein 1